MVRNHCPVCRGRRIEEIYHFGDLPLTTQYVSAPVKTYESFPLSITGCSDCHFVFISNPVDPIRLYSDNYNLTSSYPASHLDDLTERLIEKVPSYESFIFEIAANDGAFLHRFLKNGYENVLGIEPSANCVATARGKGVRVINDYFNFNSASALFHTYGKADLVIIRHAIEHIADIEGLLEGIATICSDNGSVYVEFPDTDLAFTYGKYMYFFEQHVNYFTTATCQHLFNRFGFQLDREYRFSYGGGSKGLLFSPISGVPLKTPSPDFFTNSSMDMLRLHLKQSTQKISRFIDSKPGSRFSLYGPGFVGISLINNIDIAKHLCCVFDDSPTKIGLFLPGSNLEIKSGMRLAEERPDYCLIAPLNEKKFETGIINNNKEYLNNGGHFIEFFPQGKETDFFHIINRDNQQS